IDRAGRAAERPASPYAAAGASSVGLGTAPAAPLSALAPLVTRKQAVQAIADALGDETRFFADLENEAKKSSGSKDLREQLDKEVNYTRDNWEEWIIDERADEMQTALERLVKHAKGVRASYGSVASPAGEPLPAENVAYLGRTLFTDYLLAV